jgi:peptide deformylase
MAVFKIVQYPDPVLLRPTAKVESIGQKERILVRDMIDTMHAQKGVGLAANQIGVGRSVFVANPDGQRGKEIVFFNPEIIARSGQIADEEGCLSIAGVYDRVKRHRRVTLRGLTLDGLAVEVKAEGLLARIFQHETDHLNGRLFVHRLGFFKKRTTLKRLGREARKSLSAR